MAIFEGDLLARYLLRIGEMKKSIKIIQQALEGILGEPYENLKVRHFDREKKYSEKTNFGYRFIYMAIGFLRDLWLQEIDSPRT